MHINLPRIWCLVSNKPWEYPLKDIQIIMNQGYFLNKDRFVVINHLEKVVKLTPIGRENDNQSILSIEG